MSSSHSSSGRQGPPSSPFTGTDVTAYSPEATRKAVNDGGAQQLSEVAKGKQPIVQSGLINQNDNVAGPSVTPVVQPIVKTGVVDQSAAQNVNQPFIQLVFNAINPTAHINGIDYIGLNPMPHPDGAFLNELDSDGADFISRYLRIVYYGVDLEPGTDMDQELTLVQTQMRTYLCFQRCVLTFADRGTPGVYLRFDDIEDACAGQQVLQEVGFGVNFIDSYDLAVAKMQDTATMDEFEGQVKVVILVRPNRLQDVAFHQRDIVWVGNVLERMMENFGTVRKNVHVETIPRGTYVEFIFRLEFNSVEAATRAVASLKRDPFQPDLVDNTMTHLAFTIVEVDKWNGPRAPNSPHRRRPRIDDRGRRPEFRLAPQIEFNRRQPHDAHNRVRGERILDGTDVRTTIMLRNIPNKFDWLSLKKMLDEVCFGTYDFVYLRIDFRTACNVGYAFVNFSDIGGLLAMLHKVEGKGWHGYRSSKSAEISYATIQGKDALIAKFRNSSVMQETPFCRPRLFLAFEDLSIQEMRRAGREIDFPRPDNFSKLQRSMDSARNQGLFPPAGATTGNRNVITEFDRGNPRDTAERIITHDRTTMSGNLRDRCTQAYFEMMGPSEYGMVPFEYIPETFVQDFYTRWQRETLARHLGTLVPGLAMAANPNPNGLVGVAGPSRQAGAGPSHQAGPF